VPWTIKTGTYCTSHLQGTCTPLIGAEAYLEPSGRAPTWPPSALSTDSRCEQVKIWRQVANYIATTNDHRCRATSERLVSPACARFTVADEPHLLLAQMPFRSISPPTTTTSLPGAQDSRRPQRPGVDFLPRNSDLRLEPSIFDGGYQRP